MSYIDKILDHIGAFIARRIEEQPDDLLYPRPADQPPLDCCLQPCDVLLVSSSGKVSGAIKYLTQSTWSHAALYVGDALVPPGDASTDVKESREEPHTLIEVNLGEGCISAPLSKYAHHHTRICRPVGLREADKAHIINYMKIRLGTRYDLRNVIDLGRYLFPTPPLPAKWRRRALALGAGSPTRAICSSMIAQAFQSVHYPILPRKEIQPYQTIYDTAHKGHTGYSTQELYYIRHNSLFVPADFDLSPYFQIIKPTLEQGFDYQQLKWGKA